MQIQTLRNKIETGRRGAEEGAARIRSAISARGEAYVILATGASQFEMLEALTAPGDIDWSSVTAFHLDEYVGMSQDHPASFVGYLKERFVRKVPRLRAFHFVNGSAPDPEAERARLNALISKVTIDVAFVGIGENSHLAFNDPPANFTTNDPYIMVNLDEACRRQQFGEGWFPTFDAVPSVAFSMSVRQIMKSRSIICTVPDLRKAEAVKCAVEGQVTPQCPASILQQHADCILLLDPDSASLLSTPTARS